MALIPIKYKHIALSLGPLTWSWDMHRGLGTWLQTTHSLIVRTLFDTKSYGTIVRSTLLSYILTFDVSQHNLRSLGSKPDTLRCCLHRTAPGYACPPVATPSPAAPRMTQLSTPSCCCGRLKPSSNHWHLSWHSRILDLTMDFLKETKLDRGDMLSRFCWLIVLRIAPLSCNEPHPTHCCSHVITPT